MVVCINQRCHSKWRHDGWKDWRGCRSWHNPTIVVLPQTPANGLLTARSDGLIKLSSFDCSSKLSLCGQYSQHDWHASRIIPQPGWTNATVMYISSSGTKWHHKAWRSVKIYYLRDQSSIMKTRQQRKSLLLLLQEREATLEAQNELHKSQQYAKRLESAFKKEVFLRRKCQSELSPPVSERPRSTSWTVTWKSWKTIASDFLFSDFRLPRRNCQRVLR